jgi:hypothetical protein
VRAKRRFRLVLRRGGLLPAALADPARVDHVEVIDVASGDAVLCWDLSPLGARRLRRALRADLEALEDEEFSARWLQDEREEQWGGQAGECSEQRGQGDLDEWG